MRDRIVKWLPWMLFIFIAASSGTMICRNYIWDGTNWIKQTGSSAGYQGVVIYDSGSGTTAQVNSDGQLHTVMQGKIDPNNSTEALLGIGGVFTGTGTDVSSYASISLLVHSDVASAAGGLVVQFSDDNSDWHNGESYTIPANNTKFFTPPVQSLYYRVVYTNGGTGQSDFHIHAMLHKVPIKWSSHNANDSLYDEDDGQLVVSVPKLRTAANTYVSMGGTSNGNAKMSLEELENTISVNNNSQLKITRYASGGSEVIENGFALASGAYSGITVVNKFGRAPDGAQTTITDVWDRADATPTQQIWLAPTAARLHVLQSTSANDDGDPAGTGMRTIRVYGLQTWADKESYEDIVLDGTTGVTTSNSYVIIHRMKGLTWGSAGPNVGVITATAAVDATVTAQIIAGDGQTQMAIYGIPTGQYFYMSQYYGSVHSTSSPATVSKMDLKLRVNPIPNTTTTGYLIKHTQGVISNGASFIEHKYPAYFRIPGPAIIKMSVIGSAADIDFSAGFNGYVADF